MDNNSFHRGYGFGLQQSFGERMRGFIRSRSWLNRLIVINVGVYLALLAVRLVLYLTGYLFQFSAESVMGATSGALSCPASLSQLLRQPWSIVTSLFMHANFWHLFFNMFMLYLVGRIFLEYLNDKHLLAVYLMGGIFGNIVYMTAYNLFPVFSADMAHSFAMGASGSVMAIMAAITAYRPNHNVSLFLLGRMKLVWIAVAFVIIDIVSIPKGNAGGHISHIGGFLFGLIYIAIMSKKFNSKWIFKRKEKEKRTKYYVSEESGRPLSDEEYNARKHAEKLRIDAILDKISQYGYDALSKEEKDFLFHYSKKQ